MIQAEKGMKKKYTKEDGLNVVRFLRSFGFKNVELIGSLAKKGESSNDIDVLIPKKSMFGGNYKMSRKMKKRLIKILGAEVYSYTDWEGIYLYGTWFGNVDIFFTTKYFDY